MSRKVYDINQIPLLIDVINNKYNRNACLHTMLNIVHRDKQTLLKSMIFDLKFQGVKGDIYKNPHEEVNINIGGKDFPLFSPLDPHKIIQTTDNPKIMIHDVINQLTNDTSIFCFFSLFNREDSKEVVVDSHITMTIFLKDAFKTWNVYKFNSGIVNEKVEKILDSSILEFIKYIHEYMKHYNMPPVILNFIPTTDWLPTKLQNNTNLCTIFTLNVYDAILKEKMMVKFDSKFVTELPCRREDNLRLFYDELNSKVKAMGKQQAKFV